jgi:hypothetical protein
MTHGSALSATTTAKRRDGKRRWPNMNDSTVVPGRTYPLAFLSEKMNGTLPMAGVVGDDEPAGDSHMSHESGL